MTASLRPWLGSALLHAPLIAAIVTCAGRPRDAHEPGPLAIEMVEAPAVTAPVEEPPGVAGGPSAGARAAPVPPRAPRTPRSRVAPVDLVGAVEREARVGSDDGGSERKGNGSGSGSGSGSGDGDGDGSGTGDGRRAALGADVPVADRLPAAPARPPPPAASRARPPRLIYPKRQRAESEGQVYVARLSIDHEGFVVGVRLTAGTRSRRAEAAQTSVWRFRYDPARDDAGRPIAAQIEQRFMLD